MRLPTSVVVLSLALAVALPVRAQSVVAPPSDSIPSIRIAPDTAQPPAVTVQNSEPTKGAAVTGLRAGVHLREAVSVDRPPYVAAGNRNLGQARAMMIVGLAALVSGAVIGGDAGTIIMVGGTIVGLVGLYEYLQ